MTRLIRKTPRWTVILGAIALLAVGVWQWGSYGPFEITVNTPGRTLDEVVVTVAFATVYGHRSKATYFEVRTGRSNEPIRFPRGYVCVCLRRPSMLVSGIHPAFFSATDSIPPTTLRHIGVTRMTSRPPSTWQGAFATFREVRKSMHMDEAPAQTDADINLGGLYSEWLRDLESNYVANAHLPIASVKPSVDVARQELESLPISEELKTKLRSRVDDLEVRLRERAIQ
jgi:hypothetical protein